MPKQKEHAIWRVVISSYVDDELTEDDHSTTECIELFSSHEKAKFFLNKKLVDLYNENSQFRDYVDEEEIYKHLDKRGGKYVAKAGVDVEDIMEELCRGHFVESQIGWEIKEVSVDDKRNLVGFKPVTKTTLKAKQSGSS